MVAVSIDVDALRGVVERLNDFVDDVYTEWSAVSAAAGRAATSASSLSGLYSHTSAVSDAATDLETRIDLAILYNTGADGQIPDGGVLTYELTGSSDTIESVKFQLGVELAQVAQYPTTTLTGDQLRTFLERFGRYIDDEDVMPSFFMEIGPEGLLTFMTNVASSDLEHYGGDLALQRQVLDAMRDGLETASNAWSELNAQSYARELVEAASQDPGESDYPQLTASLPAALSYLLYDSNYSDAFLASAADALDAYERVDMAGTSGLWGDRVGTDNNFFRLFPPDAGGAHYDPMVSLMSALGNDADVALDFFTGGGDADGDGVPDRQMYWIHDRLWAHDQFLHMSEALVAATTDRSLIQPPDGPDAARAAELASMAVNLLGHREGIGYYDAGMFGTDWERSAAASENFATILATYMYGVDATLQTGDPLLPGWNEAMATDLPSAYYPGVTPNVPIFNRESLEAFIALAAGNEDGLLTLRAGLNEFTAEKYALAAAYLQRNGASDDMALDIFEQAYLSQASLEGLFVDAIGDASVARAAGEDAVRQQWVALGESAIGMVPIGNLVKAAGGDQLAQTLVTFTVKQAVGASADELGGRWASLEAAERDRQGNYADNTMALAQYNVFLALNEAGLVPDSALQGPWAEDGALMSWEEFRELDPAEQVQAVHWLRNVEQGTGGIFNPFDFEVEFRDSFEEPFESN